MEQALSKVPSPSREVVRCQQDVYLDSYSLAYRTQAEMWTPRCEEEVVSCFARLRREGRRGSLRGTGYCFDRQSLGDDVSLCLTEMNRIVAVDEVQGTITVQPGVTWGEVVRRLLPTGWMMPVMPTSPKISVGGTLSCNATSRFSPVHGKEGEHVLSFVLITPRGKRLICTRAEQPELFHAVIGGFGFFGAVVEITYQLHHIGARRRIESQIEKFDDLEVLFARLREASRQGDVWDSVSSPVICSPRDRKGMV
ncbi:MAG: FAD-binding oxidoreductase, partial [Myxococcota bacterium]